MGAHRGAAGRQQAVANSDHHRVRNDLPRCRRTSGQANRFETPSRHGRAPDVSLTTMYAGLVRPILFALPPGASHSAIFAALGPVEHIPALRALVRAIAAPPSDRRLAVHIMGLEFPSPIGLAAGFDKNARRPKALEALGFGHLELGTVTARAQKANPRPNLFRLPADRALVNRLGFPNDGAKLVAERLRAVRAQIAVPVGISIGKSRAVPSDDFDAVIADYVEALDCVREVADFVVGNVSSPNTPGLRGLQGPAHP